MDTHQPLITGRTGFAIRIAAAVVLGVLAGLVGFFGLGLLAFSLAYTGPDYSWKLTDHLLVWGMVLFSLGVPIVSWVLLVRWVQRSRAQLGLSPSAGQGTPFEVATAARTRYIDKHTRRLMRARNVSEPEARALAERKHGTEWSGREATFKAGPEPTD